MCIYICSFGWQLYLKQFIFCTNCEYSWSDETCRTQQLHFDNLDLISWPSDQSLNALATKLLLFHYTLLTWHRERTTCGKGLNLEPCLICCVKILLFSNSYALINQSEPLHCICHPVMNCLLNVFLNFAGCYDVIFSICHRTSFSSSN